MPNYIPNPPVANGFQGQYPPYPQGQGMPMQGPQMPRQMPQMPMQQKPMPAQPKKTTIPAEEMSWAKSVIE